MDVSVEDISSVKKKLHIEVPREEVAKELDSAYANLKKNAKIKGYRPGKVPRSVLERKFRKDVHSEVAQTLIQNTLIEALREKDLPVLGTPDIDPSELDPNQAFTYRATVELKPELPEVDFKGLTLQKHEYQASEEEIDNQVDMLKKHLAEYHPIKEDRAAVDGDYVAIDYEGFKDGRTFEETEKTENHTMKIGQGSITEDFDQALIGMKPGESKEFAVHFPEDYHNANLAGRDITFQVTLKEIREEILPEANDEMAKELGNFNSIDDLREEIRKNLQQGYDKRSHQELQEQIFDKLITDPFEVPETLVQQEIDNIVKDAEQQFAKNGLSMEQLGMTREGMAEQYRELAEKQVRRHLLLNKIMEQEGLEISDEELEAEYQRFSETMGQPADVIRSYYQQSPEQLDAFKHALLEKKAIDLIINHATIENVPPEETGTSETTEENADTNA
ncbi:MAG TPA: trigger factor [Desulfosalsimonadaceae bacterium]|nr:trigger factor [Desulfosalsimonadaceae bacterium]